MRTAIVLFLLFVLCVPAPIILLGHPTYDGSPDIIASGKVRTTEIVPVIAGFFTMIYLALNLLFTTDFNRRSFWECLAAFETMPLIWLRLAPFPILAAVAWSSYFTSFAATAHGVTIRQGPIFGSTRLQWSGAQSIDIVCSRFLGGKGHSVQPYLIVNFAGGWKLNLWLGEGQQMFAHLPEISNLLGSVPAILHYPETSSMWHPPRHYVIDPTTATGCPRSIEVFLFAHSYTASQHSVPSRPEGF
jgi:hypothetical protein